MWTNSHTVGNKTKGQISKRRWQESRARQIFEKKKIWRALLSCYLRFEIHPFALLPTILSNSSSCADLIFTNQPNLVVHSGTHPSSLRATYHRQIIHCKINFASWISTYIYFLLKLIRMSYYLHCKMLIAIVCLLIWLFTNKWICLMIYQMFSKLLLLTNLLRVMAEIRPGKW